MIDAASGEALVNLTPKATKELISIMAANSQLFSCEPSRRPKASLESIVERIALSQDKFQNRTETHLQEIDKQISQLAQTLRRLESQGKLPSQTEHNPRANVSAITLRSGTVLEPKAPKENSQKKDKEEEPPSIEQGKSNPTPTPSSIETLPPFQSRLVKRGKQAEEEEILDIFRKAEVNIPLLEVIRRVPRYAQFLKDLCTSKRKLTGNEKVNLGEHVSTVFQQKLPPKVKDQGASINVMPLSIYKMITNEPLKDTKVTIQLADRSIINPEGLLENVLVEVDKLIFPTDFYVINMENDQSNTSSKILLGCPFLSTENTEIEVRSGLLTMEFDGEIVKFDFYKAMEHPYSMPNVSCVNTFKPFVDEYDKHDFSDKLYRNLNVETVKAREMDIASNVDSRSSCKELSENLNLMLSQSKNFSSILQVPRAFQLKIGQSQSEELVQLKQKLA
ncbi:hypothetical protein V6N13_124349 [Hibiscus sabdariffa]